MKPAPVSGSTVSSLALVIFWVLDVFSLRYPWQGVLNLKIFLNHPGQTQLLTWLQIVHLVGVKKISGTCWAPWVVEFSHIIVLMNLYGSYEFPCPVYFTPPNPQPCMFGVFLWWFGFIEFGVCAIFSQLKLWLSSWLLSYCVLFIFEKLWHKVASFNHLKTIVFKTVKSQIFPLFRGGKNVWKLLDLKDWRCFSQLISGKVVVWVSCWRLRFEFFFA